MKYTVTATSILSVLMAVGCAPSIDALNAHLAAGAFQKAVRSVDGNAKGQVELAALLVEHSIRRGERNWEGVSVLAASGAPGERALERLAEDGPPPSRSLARIATMGRRKPNQKTLHGFLRSDYADVRTMALCKWKSKLGFERIEEFVLDTDCRVRKCAIGRLSELASRHRAGVSKHLSEALRLDPDPGVRAEAAQMGHLLGEDKLFKLKAAMSDENMGVRLAALRGLAALKGEDGRNSLKGLAIRGFDELAIAAATELSRLGDDLGRRRLGEALGHSSAKVREIALLRMERGKLGKRTEKWSTALGDPSPRIVILAASALRTDDSLRSSVQNALRRIVAAGDSLRDEARDLLAVTGDKSAEQQIRDGFAMSEPAEVIRVLQRTARCSGLFVDFVNFMAHPLEEVRFTAATSVLASSYIRR